jgi:SAM-dependent methyltransferase
MNLDGNVGPERAVYVREKGILSLWAKKTSPMFWQEQWHQLSEGELQRLLRPTKYLWPSLGRVLLQWLPKNGIILDAGCGIGHTVRRLRFNGLNCMGLDYAVPTLIHSKAVCPDLPLIGGDLLKLPFADGTIPAIFSLGVLEHFGDGPQSALREMTRVLTIGGIVCLSVPYENALRRKLPTVSDQEAVSKGLEFYQYYFTPSFLKSALEEVGLHPLNLTSTYDVYQGLQDHHCRFRKLIQLMPKPKYWSFLLDFIPWLPERVGHMFITVAEKNKDVSL